MRLICLTLLNRQYSNATDSKGLRPPFALPMAPSTASPLNMQGLEAQRAQLLQAVHGGDQSSPISPEARRSLKARLKQVGRWSGRRWGGCKVLAWWRPGQLLWCRGQGRCREGYRVKQVGCGALLGELLLVLMSSEITLDHTCDHMPPSL